MILPTMISSVTMTNVTRTRRRVARRGVGCGEGEVVEGGKMRGCIMLLADHFYGCACAFAWARPWSSRSQGTHWYSLWPADPPDQPGALPHAAVDLRCGRFVEVVEPEYPDIERRFQIRGRWSQREAREDHPLEMAQAKWWVRLSHAQKRKEPLAPV